MSNAEDKAHLNNGNPVNNSLQRADEYPVAFPINYQHQQQEEEIHLRDYLRVILRRKWTVITFFVVVVTTVLIGTFMMTPIYRASVTIKIDKENPNVLKFKDVYDVERIEDDYYQTQYKVLKSRNLAKRVVRNMKLDQNPEFVKIKETKLNVNPIARVSAGEQNNDSASIQESINLNEGLNQGIIDSFLKKLTIEPMLKSRLVKVSFDSASPQLSAAVANETAKSYIDFNIESKFDATQQARDWLEKQLDEMKAKVERAEEALNAYAAQKGIIILTERTGGTETAGDVRTSDIVTKKLSEISTHLVQATSDRLSREALYRETLHSSPDSMTLVLNNLLVQDLKKEYARMEVEYSQLLKVYKPDYPKMVRLNEQMTQMKSRIDTETQMTIASIKGDYEAAVKREDYLKSTLEKYKSEALSQNEKMVQYQILKREAETNRELYNGLLQRLKETGISASLTTSNIQVLDRAEVPQKPHIPKKSLNLLLALITGLFGGVGLAFFVEYLDNTVKTPDDIEKGVALPSLGIVPSFGKQEDRQFTSMITFDDKKSPLSEAYRSIGTYIQFSSAVRPPKTMLVTSARQGEGKTTTVLNTAITLAHSYGKGIIIDADLRKPKLHKLLDVDNSAGLSAFLTGNVEFGPGLIQQTKVANLDIITSGIIPPNPSELLSSFRMKELINNLSPLYSFIILDSPPILGLSDSIVISTLIDGVIVVIRAGSTTKDAAVQARKLLQGVNAKVLGVVLNGIKERDLKYGAYSYYYSYYYEEGYGDKGKKKRSRKDS